jgi:MSHA biogenesis protein MshI
MIQQINLYHKKLKPSTDSNPFTLYASALALLLIVLLGYCGFIYYETDILESEIQQAQNQHTEAEARLQQIETQYPQQQINSLLVTEIASMRNRLKAFRKLVNSSSDTQSDQTQGFSRYFMALANQTTSEAWLNRIFINSQENAIILQGSTFKSATLPDLLHRLQQETVFHGKKFARLSMKQSTQQPSQIDFTVSSKSKQEKAL